MSHSVTQKLRFFFTVVLKKCSFKDAELKKKTNKHIAFSPPSASLTKTDKFLDEKVVTSVSSAVATACQVIKCGHMPVLFIKYIFAVNCHCFELHSVIRALCLVSSISDVFVWQHADRSVFANCCHRAYVCVGPWRGVDSRVASNVLQSRGVGVSRGSGVSVFGWDWDFSARLRGRHHIRMLHSIKAVQG